MLIANILLYNLDPLDYKIPEELEINKGDLVIVPFRNQKLLGLVWNIDNKTNIPHEKLRYIEQKTPYKIPKLYFDFIKFVSDYYLFKLGSIFKMMFPVKIASSFIKGNELQPEQFLNSPDYKDPNFNNEQLEAINTINNYIDEKAYNIIIDGVTGSGKTEVYLSAINKIIKTTDSQVLILIPEISLVNQVIDRVRKRFNYEPELWHSSLSEKQKREVFLKIIDGSARIIIGARSALFLPFKNLSMIVVDEEHEQSYKQEEGVTYQARDMAIMRAKFGNIPIILASASPSLESLHNVNQGRLKLVSLKARYNDKDLPNIQILDMKKERFRNFFVSPKIISALKKNLK
ncbi:MAG: primosomal protein N', partial [Pseudomonadota bacterium]